MPQQSEGRMRGFQLWLNLPGKEKMKPAAYRDIASREIPVVQKENVKIKVIAGRLEDITGPIAGGSTDPYYWDVHLEANATFEGALPAGHNAFVYVYDGQARVGEKGAELPNRAAGVLAGGSSIRISSKAGARVLVLAGKPIGEPIVQYGPFVMNSREEIEQAIADYQSGRFSRERIGRIDLAR
ncbi:MAG: pirin family protein, partial [Clostridia bacterium]